MTRALYLSRQSGAAFGGWRWRDVAAGLALLAGLLNWLSVGLLGVDLFAALLGSGPWALRLAYLAVGVAACHAIVALTRAGSYR